MRRVLVLAIAALGLGGCLRDADPFELDTSTVSVHVVLVAGEDSATALVTRPSVGGGAGIGVPVSDAVVRLSTGGDTVSLPFDTAADCLTAFASFGPFSCYRGALPQTVVPGATYDLEIVLADGGRITGHTTVPYPVEVRAPDPGATIVARCDGVDTCYGTPTDEPPFIVPVAELPLSWTQAPGVHGVFIAVRATMVFLNGTAYAGATCRLGSLGSSTAGTFVLEADSLEWAIPNIGCDAPLQPARFDSIRAEAIIAASNPEYSRYAEAALEWGRVRAASVAEGLDGAWGVFGAVTPARRSVTIVRAPAP